ncbi:MAG: magnesium-translocating P-type ATPase, partial [Methanomassiliicoccaceae archaeon]|nr:magnesium-translocating P-type ATPase [Methanomassiliicoccaceae archaeon]
MQVKKNDGNKKTKQLEAKERLLDCAHKEPGTALSDLDNSLSGYEDERLITHMRDKYGKNIITKAKKVSLPRRIFNAFINPFTGILIALAIIAFVADKDLVAVSIISTMVCISGLLRFIQESRSGKAAEKLTAMVKTTIATYRGSPQKPFEIPISELVVGDVIHLAAGDMVPADVRILKAKDFFISQSSMTGESEPVEKTSKGSELQSKNPLDYDNLAFMGTNVIGGSAIAMVCTVGDDTLFGDVAKKVAAKKAPTGFEKGVKSVSWLLIRFMAIMAPTVLLINGFTKGDWPEAALFALAIAVGLTPEMLPLIVSANLAKGAMVMSRKHVIVKDLNSIQNFGGMDVLCTDKTGTITQDKIILEYHLDIHGKEDPRVLRHAFLNSYYQTGLKNLMDIAIVDRARELGLDGASERYDKLDEIPFDFNRRRMSVVVADKNGKTQLITKGAIEEMLSICADAEYNGKLEPMTDALRNEILTTVRRYNTDGMRVLGVAHKNNPPSAGVFSTEDENEMTLIGYLAFLDPPKETAPEAVRSLKERG